MRLALFDRLAHGPATAEALAHAADLPLPAMVRLLDAAVALRLFSRRGRTRYGLGALGAAMVGNPGLSAMVTHHALLYADLADPVALLRGDRATALNQFWAYAADVTPEPATTRDYSALMAASQPMVAAEILRAIDLRPHRVLLDAGGGLGAFATAALRAAPHLHAIVMDLPAVTAQATEALAAAGLSDRAQATPGDLIAGPWPDHATLITLVRILHDHNDEDARRILANAHAALAPGGTLVIAEPMADMRGAEPVGAYFAFYLLAMGQGRPRSRAELSSALQDAGFAHIRALDTRAPLITALLTARKV